VSGLAAASADPRDHVDEPDRFLQKVKQPSVSIAAVLMALAGLQIVKSIRNECPSVIRAWRIAAGLAPIQ
jgi:hypothetical protein